MPTVSGIHVEGRSVAGFETCIRLPGYGLCFDIGTCPRPAVRLPWVFITHGHLDHSYGVAKHAATRALTHLDPATYVVPEPDVQGIEAVMHAHRRMDRSRFGWRILPARPGEPIPLSRDRRIVPFATRHPVPSLGYTLFERRNKLKDEYRGLPGERLRVLREQGVGITREVWFPDVAYPGDSLIDVLDTEPAVRRARVLILEATFLDDRVTVAACRAKGHVHLDEIVDRAPDLENKAVILVHFSSRYTVEEIRTLLWRRLPPSLRERVTVLLPGEKHLARWKPPAPGGARRSPAGSPAGSRDRG